MKAQPFSALVDAPVHGDDVMISGIALDSRKVMPGYLFCAVKGETQDGHAYLPQALANGASAVALENAADAPSLPVSYVVLPDLKKQLGHIAARFYQHPAEHMRVVGITGTNGKTSVAAYVAQLMALNHISCGQVGTLGVHYAGQLLETQNTTPGAFSLQHAFFAMHQAGVEAVAMEVSSHAMEQFRCEGIGFNTVVFTNLTHDHLDYHGSFSAYRDAKLKLFRQPQVKTAIVNLDDANAVAFIDASTAQHVQTYALTNNKADVYLSDVQRQVQGYRAVLHVQDKNYALTTPLLGEFNLSNMLAAVCVMLAQGVEVGKIAEQCRCLQPVPGRMQTIANDLGITAVVDYAHTPDALEKVLQNLRRHTQHKLIVVFGCGGNRDTGKRPLMAKITEQNADFSIVTTDNPRHESVDVINNDIIQGFEGSAYRVVTHRAEAIAEAVDLAVAGDCIVVAGKGHEAYQQIGDSRFAFDDAQVLQQCLLKKAGAA